MSARISVCIPTYNRPDLFEEALHSALSQDLTPYEVLVGDDSTNEETKQVANKWKQQGAPVRYFKNEPSLGQAHNVDQLLQQASGEYVVLLHDDDLLLENALSHLLACFDEYPDAVAAFGKQQMANESGKVRWEATKNLNNRFYRTHDFDGKQPSPLRSAITQQFPNDGYMVCREAAKSVGYIHEGAGDACDFMFGIKLAQKVTGDFIYTDQCTSLYRRTEESIGRGEDKGDAAYYSFRYVHSKFKELAAEDPYINEWMRRRAPVSIMTAANHGYAYEGLRWFFGPYHRHRILSLGGMHRFLCLIKTYFLHIDQQN